MTDANPSTDQNVWCLTDKKINDLQTASIDGLIARCKQAHFVNVQIRINGEFETHEADWLKHLRRVTEPADMSRLMSFYDVATLQELVLAQNRHIEKLQSKLPPEGNNMRPERVREG